MKEFILVDPVLNVTFINPSDGTIYTILKNQHIVEGHRLYTVIVENPKSLNVYTETLDDIEKRLELSKEKILRTFKEYDNILNKKKDK